MARDEAHVCVFAALLRGNRKHGRGDRLRVLPAVLDRREELLGEAVLFGWHGGVPGGANIAPKLYVDVYTAAMAKDIETLVVLQQRVMQILTMIYGTSSYGSAYLDGLKCALSCMGICDDFMAEPFHRFIGPERETIRGYLVDLGLLKSG